MKTKVKAKEAEFRATVLCSKPGALKRTMTTVMNTYKERNVGYNWAVKFFATLFQLVWEHDLGLRNQEKVIVLKVKRDKTTSVITATLNFVTGKFQGFFRMSSVHSRSAREHRDTEKIGGSNLTSNP